MKIHNIQTKHSFTKNVSHSLMAHLAPWVALFTMACTPAWGAIQNKIETTFSDIPTAVFPVKSGFRVIFRTHNGVYYLLKTDADFVANTKVIQQARVQKNSVTVEADATYLNIHKAALTPN